MELFFLHKKISMIKNTFLLVAVLSAFAGLAQTKVTEKEFIGTWKVVNLDMDNGKVFMDMDKDSLYVMDSLRKTWKTKEDSAMVMAVMYGLGNAFKEMEFTFAPGGVYTVKTAKKIQNGSFKLDDTGIVKTSIGNDAMTFIPYKGMLKSEMEMQKGKVMRMFFRKVETEK
jgi:hypothetical protein